MNNIELLEQFYDWISEHKQYEDDEKILKNYEKTQADIKREVKALKKQEAKK